MNSNIRWQQHDVPGVWIGEAPGFDAASQPTMAVSGGVHGNEKTGIHVVNELVNGTSGLNLDAGRIIAIHGNLEAMGMGTDGQRATVPGLNLNRYFRELDAKYAHMDPKDRPYEVRRAQELMEKVLNNLDEDPSLRPEALVDIHDFKDPNGPVFMITEPYFGLYGRHDNSDGFGIARAIGGPKISSGWKEADKGGSDGWMTELGRIGICIEAGYQKSSQATKDYGHGAVARLAVEMGMLDANLQPLFIEQGEPVFIHNEGPHIRQTDQPYKLLLPEHLRQTFTPIPEGEDIALMDGEIYVAPKGKLIIFPEVDAPVGTEAFYYAHEYDPRQAA
ncbi:MAG: hypothetical protein JWO47_157 [Candidatus Saccharibacteria bacterium]|nr:hypothetical protein [Candidatus Saccharibacteria bacterium]